MKFFVLNQLSDKLHMYKTYKLPEDGQQPQPKHVGALIKKTKKA
jgi:hypothetical protein